MVYIDNDANLTVGVSSLTTPAVTCSGCVVMAGITQYPLGTIPVEVWNATNGSWDPSGTSNLASLSVAPALVAGDNITLTRGLRDGYYRRECRGLVGRFGVGLRRIGGLELQSDGTECSFYRRST